MKVMMKAFAKQYFGAKYEGIAKSLTICVILFLAVYGTQLKVRIAPSVFYLTSTAFSGGIMAQMLFGRRLMENMEGMFVLPFKNRDFVLAGLPVSVKPRLTEAGPAQRARPRRHRRKPHPSDWWGPSETPTRASPDQGSANVSSCQSWFNGDGFLPLCVEPPLAEAGPRAKTHRRRASTPTESRPARPRRKHAH